LLNLPEKIHILVYCFLFFAFAIIAITVFYYFKNKGITAYLKALVIFVIIGIMVIFDMYFIEPNWIKTERVVVHDPALAEVLEGIKVVHISDIHLQGGLGYREKKLVEKVNELRPDLLFITGDFFGKESNHNNIGDLKSLTELIRSFKVSTDIFGVFGNYDHKFARTQDFVEELKHSGIDILFNESKMVALPNNKFLWVAGIDHIWDRQNKTNLDMKFKKAIENIPANSPMILLSHYPDIFGRAIISGVNLVLAGHTHGGQVGVPFLVHASNSANKSTFLNGLFDGGKTKMYVNRGIGTTKVPIRFLCRPEITVLEIER
jgi:uncharacterized protein